MSEVLSAGPSTITNQPCSTAGCRASAFFVMRILLRKQRNFLNICGLRQQEHAVIGTDEQSLNCGQGHARAPTYFCAKASRTDPSSPAPKHKR